MPIRRLKGPHALRALDIDSLESTFGPAVYVLGTETPDGSITIARLGLTAIDLKTHLEQYIGRYTHFKFYSCATTEQAYVLACELYHAYLPADNAGHPTVNAEEMLSCPYCGYTAVQVSRSEQYRG